MLLLEGVVYAPEKTDPANPGGTPAAHSTVFIPRSRLWGREGGDT